jgi:hypothetical protein
LMLHEQKMYMGVEVEVDIEKEMDMEWISTNKHRHIQRFWCRISVKVESHIQQIVGLQPLQFDIRGYNNRLSPLLFITNILLTPHPHSHSKGVAVIVSWEGWEGKRGLELTCMVPNITTGHTRRGWQSLWTGRGRKDWGWPVWYFATEHVRKGWQSMRAGGGVDGSEVYLLNPLFCQRTPLNGLAIISGLKGRGNTGVTQRGQLQHASGLVSNRFSIRWVWYQIGSESECFKSGRFGIRQVWN